MKSAIRLATVLSAVLLLGSPARADIPPPETEPCLGKQVGDACVYNGAGTCQNQTCSKLDYATGGSTTYACVKCVVGTSTNADGGPPPSEDDGGCSIGRHTTAKRVVPWLLAAAFSLLFVWRRRRR